MNSKELEALRTSLEDAIGASGYAHTSNWAIKHGRSLLTHIAAQDARIEALEGALWKVIAYDQFLRKIGEITQEVLLAGEMPKVDACYDDMVKTAVAALAGKAALGGEQHGG